MIVDGIRADILRTVAFEGSAIHPVSQVLNDWLEKQQGTIIHDIICTGSDKISVLVIYRQLTGSKPITTHSMKI